MQDFLQHLFSQYPILAPVIFIIARIAAIVIPPIPGLVVDLLGIATFGWLRGLMYGMVGVALGSAVAFWIGRRFREPLVRRFVTLRYLHTWEREIDENRKFWYLVVFRFLSSPFQDYVSYVAGLTNISIGRFTLASIIGLTPVMIYTYYFGGFFIGKGTIIGILFILLTIVVGYLFKQYSTERYK